jgi:energy-coupling factor transporter ATP-binding protein EcfA2
MQLHDLKHLTQDQLIEFTFEDETINTLNLKTDISLHQIHGDLLLKQKDLLLPVSNPEVLQSFGKIDNFLWIPIALKNKKLAVQTIPCLPNSLDFEDIEASIDETIIEQVAQKAKIKDISVNDAANWLKEEFTLVYNDESHVLFAVSSNIKSSIYTIIGKNNLLHIEFTPDKGVWVKSIKTLSRNNKLNLSLCKVALSFADQTVAARIKDPLMKAKLEELNRDNAAYINLWNEYNEKVKEKAIELAKTAGFVRYVKLEMEDSVDGIKWKFYFQEKDIEKVSVLQKALKESSDVTLEINNTLPPWLENNIGDISLEKEEKNTSIKARFITATNQFISLSLNSSGKPKTQGVIYLSISGSLVQMQRREKARDSITKLLNPMKDLRFLIEDRDISVSQLRKAKRLKPITPSARKSFKGEPTNKQIEALDVALNTPDIALILGPPGTGKTQVISALQNRLAEEHKSNMTGQILLTSFQNDAVDNVIARSEAFGIPAIRADDNIRAPFLLEQWSKKQSRYLTDVLSNLTQTEGSYKIVQNLYKDIAAILDTRVEKKQKQVRVKSLIEDVGHLREHHGFNIPLALIAKVEDSFLIDKEEPKAVKSAELLKLVRGLRVTPRSYADDGFEQCFNCMQALRRTNRYPDEIAYLLFLSDQITLQEEDFEKLRSLKNRLLDDLIPDYRPKSLQANLSQNDVSNILNLEESITEFAKNNLAGIPDVIDEYLNVIKYQPEYLATSVQHYTTSVGASCQRSAGEQVVRYKESINAALNEVTAEHEFDTVIVDEAARANPLDLFIPMALASRRIVLVGDHFQLPQMLEPEIEKEMVEGGNLDVETAKAIKMSLFERLYTQLKAREAKDGIQRTVMLDTQFRMHPDLGEFISKNFYESEGEQPILSGLEASRFDMGIPKYSNKVAQWIDIPLSKGKEQRAGTSWQRECEADSVVTEVLALLTESPNLSIGVITFFAAQREVILEKLSQVNICLKTKDGWEFLPGFKTTKDGEEKLRVGSVDAFQGKEFDVVILSTVRANNFSSSDENSFRKKYGFIRTPNRLNVAFSRARSLIKVVGDKDMFSGESARQAIPQVWSFYHQLCEVAK